MSPGLGWQQLVYKPLRGVRDTLLACDFMQQIQVQFGDDVPCFFIGHL